MIRFDNIQDHVKTLIDASTYFSDTALGGSPVLVVADRGKSKSAIEGALQDSGIVVVIDPPHGGRVYAKAPGVVHVVATVAVHLQVNPLAYPDTIDLTTALMELYSAILSYEGNGGGTDTDEADRYEAVEDEDTFGLVIADEGLAAYVALFNKKAVLNS